MHIEHIMTSYFNHVYTCTFYTATVSKQLTMWHQYVLYKVMQIQAKSFHNKHQNKVNYDSVNLTVAWIT